MRGAGGGGPGVCAWQLAAVVGQGGVCFDGLLMWLGAASKHPTMQSMEAGTLGGRHLRVCPWSRTGLGRPWCCSSSVGWLPQSCVHSHPTLTPNTHTLLTLNHHYVLLPHRRLLSAQALLSQLEKQASDVATSAAAAANRRRELEKKQEELKNNLKVGEGLVCACMCCCEGFAYLHAVLLHEWSARAWLAAAGSCCASLAQRSLLKLSAVSVPLLL